MRTMPKISDINEIIRASQEADSKVHSEQRTNVLLYSGEHYSKRAQEYFSQVRESATVNKEQKLRITKNHIRRIINYYINGVITAAPSAVATPNNENELQDVKAAELHHAVIKYNRKKYDLPKKHLHQAQDFFIQGEVWDKVTWNPHKGRLLGYKPKIHPETGEPEQDEWGRPVAGDEPVFSGALDLERIWSWNGIRDKNSNTLEESKVLGFTKLSSRKELEEEYENDPDKLKFVRDAASDPIRVFDPGNGAYYDSKDQVVVRELYWRPCKLYPNGWYNISTRSGILEEGELPFGLFPLLADGCIDQASSARMRSPVKDLRPYQIEINRAFSKVAEHQITLGDDKLVLPNGSTLTQGSQLPGIRTYKTSGAPPIVIEGRSGAQYLEYGNSQVEEMYAVGMAKELLEEKTDSQQDPYAMMYKSLRQKKAFSLYADKFERYLTKYYELILETLRHYVPEDEIIPMIGRNEIVNLEEFKNASPLDYQITLEPTSDDIETMMGDQLTFNHILQYVGPQLSRNDIGKIITQMPFLAEGKRIFSDLVIDEENANNIILQMDRGVLPNLKPGLNKEYTLTRLTSRQNKSDYDFLDPGIQQNYDIFIQQIQQGITLEAQQIKAMEADMIPAQGFLVPCDFYVPDPKNPEVTKRAKLPIDALGWLVQRLEQQGSFSDKLEGMQQSAVAGLAQSSQIMQGAAAQQAIGQDSNLQGGGTNGTPNIPSPGASTHHA